jgi:glycosyltransferase involved in cell wall biosynthesis
MRISVVIPVRNEAASIGALLNSLLNQTLPPAEIVITDGGSTDATIEIISEFISNGAPVRLFREFDSLPGRSRNLAAAQASNEWIAFIDAGTKPEAGWLASLAEQGSYADIVYGSYEPIVDTLFKKCAVIASVAPPVEIHGRLVRTRSVASMMLKRAIWQAVGGFPENLRSAEDLLFLNAIEQKSSRIAHAPSALVHWQVQVTPLGTFKRFVTYARNNMRAGLWRQWQAAIFKRYGLLLVSAVPAFWFGARWFLVSTMLWFLMLASRASVALWRNRLCYPAGIAINTVRMLVLIPILGMLDAATIIGTFQWAAKDKLSP